MSSGGGETVLSVMTSFRSGLREASKSVSFTLSLHVTTLVSHVVLPAKRHVCEWQHSTAQHSGIRGRKYEETRAGAKRVHNRLD
jgi:hypothetical protein